MEIILRGNKLEMTLDPDDAKGLYAVITGQPQTVTQEHLERGQYAYRYFFEIVQELATGARRNITAPPWKK